MKTQEVPPILRGFHKVFEKLCNRWDYGQVFDDFLSIGMCCFAWETEEDWYFEIIKRYDKKELDLFAQMMGEMMLVYDRFANGKENKAGFWIDPLGMWYELICSKSKSQAMGQFFTPNGVCDMMAQMLYEPKEEIQKINDPACGSGRILLSYHSLNPGKDIFIGQDKDFMCVKMTAINMYMHGMVGQVHHMNTLSMEYYTGFAINQHLNLLKHPSILRLKDKKPFLEKKPAKVKEPEPQQKKFEDIQINLGF